MQPIARMIRAYREARGLTLAQLAAAVGTTRSYLSMIENQRVAAPSRKLLEALQQALGIEHDALIRAGQWQRTPEPIRAHVQQLAEDARRGKALAQWLKDSTSPRRGGGKNLDKLYRTGQLKKRIHQMLGDEPAAHASPTTDHATSATDDGRTIPTPPRHVPLINSVAAGYPSDFTDLDYPARVADAYVPLPPAAMPATESAEKTREKDTPRDVPGRERQPAAPSGRPMKQPGDIARKGALAVGVSDPDMFALRVVGESMLPDYREGDIVIFSPAADVTEGCDCLVRLEPDHQTTFKRVFFQEEGYVRLQPLNPRFAASTHRREALSGLYRAIWRYSRV